MEAQRISALDSPRATPTRHKSIANNGYLLIKSWGCGFYSDVFATLGALLLAEITDRTPVIHWGKNSRFGSFENFFEPINSFGVGHIPQTNFFPSKWNPFNLEEEDISKWEGQFSRMHPESYMERSEEVAVCDFFVGIEDLLALIPATHVMYGKKTAEIYQWLMKKYLSPRKEIVRRANAFHRQNFKGLYVAIHLRGSDKVAEVTNLDAVNKYCIEALANLLNKVSPGVKIFVLTDDEKWLNIMKREFGSRVVATKCKRTEGNMGTHFFHPPGITLGEEVMVDVLLASRAEVFIGNGGSNVSLAISCMRDWPEGQCALVGEKRWSSAQRLQKPE